jgi:hypothetical protein
MNTLRLALLALAWICLTGFFSTSYRDDRRLISATLSPDGRHFQLLMSEVDTRWKHAPLSHNATRESLRAELWAIQIPVQEKRVGWQEMRATARNVYAGLDDGNFYRYRLSGDVVLRKLHANTPLNSGQGDIVTRCRLRRAAPCEALPEVALPTSVDVKDFLVAPSLNSAIVSGQVYQLSDWRSGAMLANRPGFQKWQQLAQKAFSGPGYDMVWRQINAEWLLAYAPYRDESDTLLALAYHLPSDKVQEIARGPALPKTTLVLLDAQHDGKQWLFFLHACPSGTPGCKSDPLVYETDQQRLHAMPDQDLADTFAQRIWLPSKRQILLFEWLGERRDGDDEVMQIRTFAY